jgi:hypothetical protein
MAEGSPSRQPSKSERQGFTLPHYSLVQNLMANCCAKGYGR